MVRRLALVLVLATLPALPARAAQPALVCATDPVGDVQMDTLGVDRWYDRPDVDLLGFDVARTKTDLVATFRVNVGPGDGVWQLSFETSAGLFVFTADRGGRIVPDPIGDHRPYVARAPGRELPVTGSSGDGFIRMAVPLRALGGFTPRRGDIRHAMLRATEEIVPGVFYWDNAGSRPC